MQTDISNAWRASGCSLGNSPYQMTFTTTYWQILYKQQLNTPPKGSKASYKVVF